MPRVLRALPLLACLAVAGRPAAAAELVGVRLLTVAKDSATLRIELSEPGLASVSWGEEPGAWKQSSRATAPADVHELKMPGLAPDRRYFYQVEVDGAPAGDMSTFLSGRSWVTRRATILATASVPGAAPEDAELAERLFARESDALVLLGGEGDPATLRTLHGRALADRLVLTGAGATAATASIADVTLAWPGADLGAAAAAAGSCWKVALGAEAPGADVVLRAGDASGVSRNESQLVVTLAGRDSVELAFVSGTLTATLTTPAGPRTQTLQRTCTAPPPATPVDHSDGSELEEESLDGGHHDSECDLP